MTREDKAAGSSPCSGRASAPNYQRRIRDLQARMEKEGLAGVLLFQSRDVFYYTGTAQPARLFVRPGDYRLFVRSGLDFVLLETPLPADLIQPLRRLEDVCGLVAADLGPGQRLGTELDVLPANDFLIMSAGLEGLEILDCSPLIREQRSLKDDWEVEAIRRSCRIVEAGHHRAREVLRPGMTELELAALIEAAHREAGHEGACFIRQNDFLLGRGPLGSGPNLARFSGVVYSVTGVGLSPALPVGGSNRIMESGDLVMIDVPVMSQGYHADLARTYHLGPIPDSTARMFDNLSRIFDHTLSSIRPGLTGAEVYRSALDKAKELGEEERFLSFGPGRGSRLVGHGIGLDVNEPPVLASWGHTPLEPRTVLAVEIHLADADGRVVKLEDMVLVTNDGQEVLTVFPTGLCRI
jgi:Xaa-Pro dipeptidase